MQRVWVVGNSGSGKTTLATSLARRLDAPHIELDGLYHQRGWQPLDLEQFRARVAEQLAAPRWVVDGNYAKVSDLILARADTVAWIDLSRATVMRQLLGRTVRRSITRQQLWNGNREPLLGMFSRNPERSVVLWAWRSHDEYAERYTALAEGSNVVRLRSRRDVERFLADVAAPSTGPVG